MRVRLRNRHPDEEAFYTERYPTGYHHGDWSDHVERVVATVTFATPWVRPMGITSVADLSCGDGAVVRELVRRFPDREWRTYLGDLNPLSDTSMAGPVDHTVVPGSLPQSLAQIPAVDLYVCSETLEHLDDPDDLLQAARIKARYLLLTTPDGEQPSPDGGGNTEHYWGWDTGAMGAMLRDAGWTPVDHTVFTPTTADVYRFQFWLCR